MLIGVGALLIMFPWLESIKEKQVTNTFYPDALEVLSPLRFHINELIMEMESYNRFAERMNYPKLSVSKISEATKASVAAEQFFCGVIK